MSARPTIRLRVETPGAAGAAGSLRDVASAQRDVAAAQVETAQAAEQAVGATGRLSGALRAAGERAAAFQGAAAKANAVIQAMGAVVSPSVDGVVALGSALGALPGPLGLVGSAVAAATTGFKMLRDAVSSTTVDVANNAQSLSFWSRSMSAVNAQLAEARAVQQALEGKLPTPTARFEREDREEAAALLREVAESEKAVKAAEAELERFVRQYGATGDALIERMRLDKVQVTAATKEVAVLGRRAQEATFRTGLEQYQLLQNELDFAAAGLDAARAKLRETGERVRGELPDVLPELSAAPARATVAAVREAEASLLDLAQALPSRIDVGGSPGQGTLMLELFGTPEAAKAIGGGVAAATDEMSDSLGRQIAEMERAIALEEDRARAMVRSVQAQTQMTQALTGSAEAYGASALAAALYGDSIGDAINATARAAFIEGTVGALGATARGWAFTAINPPAAPSQFKSAAVFGAQAAIAGAVAGATGGLTGGAGAAAAPARAPEMPMPEDFARRSDEGPRTTEIVLTLDRGQGDRGLSRGDATALLGALVDIQRGGSLRGRTHA